MVTVLGIRHHGVGSARQLEKRLAELKPDYVLVEGAPEITDMFPFIGHEDLVPPVAVMIYEISQPRLYSFYPFTEFSPEWVAIQYANQQKIPVSAIDLPARLSLQTRLEEESIPLPKVNPLQVFAEAAGFSDVESWWDALFERQTSQSAEDHFKAVELALLTIRAAYPETDEETLLREAFMRSQIIEVQNQMYENIVVICGAWHLPVLLDLDKTARADAKRIKDAGKSKLKTNVSWVPWTNQRLSMYSGYGAGIPHPAWYEFLWKESGDITTNWLVKAARLFRNKKIDISSAHIIEASRLATQLTALRGKHAVGYQELYEAIITVFCTGDDVIFKLIENEFIIAPKTGKLPDSIPKLPLQEDFELQVKKCRMPLPGYEKELVLDLRKELDLERSYLLNRLDLLGLPFGRRQSVRAKGTFKESWLLHWSPDLLIHLIDAAHLGNTIEFAVSGKVLQEIEQATDTAALAALLPALLQADLQEIFPGLVTRIQELAMTGSDLMDLMQAMNPMVQVSRYGDVRKADLDSLSEVIQQIFTKINAGLSNYCYGLDEEQSLKMIELMLQVNQNIKLLDDAHLIEEWYKAHQSIINKETLHQVLIGFSVRLLIDHEYLQAGAASTQLEYGLSVNKPAEDVAFWVQGFLFKSGEILLFDQRLWNLVYVWVEQLSVDDFEQLLPFLRKTFSQFDFGIRRELGEKAKKGTLDVSVGTSNDDETYDTEAANQVMRSAMKWMGLTTTTNHE
jgi:hypothetical protein